MPAARGEPLGLLRPPGREDSERAKRHTALTEKIKALHAQSKGVYGSPPLQAALEREGEKVSIGTVKKIMRREGLRSKLAPKRKQPKRETAISKNLLAEEGDPSRPNQAWSGDFTSIWTREGWLYLASVINLFSRRIVGWAFGTQATKELVIQALEMGVKDGQPEDVQRAREAGFNGHLVKPLEPGVLERMLTQRTWPWANPEPSP